MAVAVKDGDKGVIGITDRQPAAGVACHQKILGIGVFHIQGEALLGVPRPGASIAIDIKVEIPRQLIASATGNRTAVGSARRTGTFFIAGSGQVVAYVVEHRQAVDFDQAISIMINAGTQREADAVSVFLAVTVRGSQLE